MFDDDEFDEIMKGLKFGSSKKKTNQPQKQVPRASGPKRSAQSKERKPISREMDVGSWLDEVEQLRGKIAALERESNQKEQANSQLKSNLKALQKQLDHKPDFDIINKHKHEVEQFKSKNVSLQKENRTVVVQNDQLQQRILQLEKENRKLQTDVHSAQQKLQSQQNTKVFDLFKKRGLKEQSEYMQMLKMILDNPHSHHLLSHFATNAPQQLEEFLQDVRLVWKQAPSQARLGGLCVEVSPERCEITGGLDLEHAKRNFIDGFLLNGLRSGLIVVPNKRYEFVLRSLIQHHAVHISMAFGNSHPTTEQLKQKPQVVSIWNPNNEDFSKWEQVGQKVLYSSGPTLCQFLLDSSQQLQ